MYLIRLSFIKSWKRCNCVFASFAKQVTPRLFLGQTDDFCLSATVFDWLVGEYNFFFSFFVSSFWRKLTNYFYSFCWNNKRIVIRFIKRRFYTVNFSLLSQAFSLLWSFGSCWPYIFKGLKFLAAWISWLFLYNAIYERK